MVGQVRTTERIIYGATGQSIAYRVLSGRPTSATFVVREDTEGDDAAAQFSGTATVDTYSTTVDEASGPSQSDPRELHVAATSGATIGRLLLLGENSRTEWVEPIEVKSGDSLICRHPLKRDYTTAATLKSTTVTMAIDATWAATEDHLSYPQEHRPRWRMRLAIVNAAAATEIQYTYFDLVRAQVDPSVVLSDLDTRWPGLMRSIPADHQRDGGAALAAAAWRSLRADLVARGYTDSAIRDAEGLDEAQLLRLRLLLAEGGMAPAGWSPGEFFALARDAYFAFLAQQYEATDGRAMSTTQDGATAHTRDGSHLFRR